MLARRFVPAKNQEGPKNHIISIEETSEKSRIVPKNSKRDSLLVSPYFCKLKSFQRDSNPHTLDAQSSALGPEIRVNH